MSASTPDPYLALDFVRAERDALRAGVGPLIATTRCYKRPDSKLERDPGPCGTCAVCLAKRAYYGSEWREY
jgi:7-cyano-7-deazaguanine synthase in queuosine biosynthesis